MQALPYWRLSGFYFCYFALVGAFSPYWGLYLQSLRFSALQIGVLMSLLQVMRIFAPNLWGWLADRLERRVAIVRVAALACFASFLGAFAATGFAGLFAVMALMSFFWSASLPLVEAITLGHLEDRPGSYGRIRLWGSVGFIVAVLGIGHLLDFLPVAVLLPISAALCFGVLICAGLLPEAQVRHFDEPPSRPARYRPEVAALFAACFLMAAAHGPYYAFYSIYLDANGYSKSAVGWLWAIGVIFEIAVFAWLPRLYARYTVRQILLASFAAAVLRFLLIAWGVASFPLMFVAQILHAASFGSYHAAAVAAIHRFFPGRHGARGQALYTSLTFGAGGTLGSLYSGFLWERVGPAATFTLAAGCALGGLLLVRRRVAVNEPAFPKS